MQVLGIQPEGPIGQRLRVDRRKDGDGLAEDLFDPRVSHHRSRELCKDPADEAHRPREEIEQRDEPDQTTEREPSGGHPPRTHQQKDRRDEGRERVEGRLERGSQVARVDPLVTQRPRLDREPFGLGRLAPEGLHHQRAVDRLVGDGRDLADPLLRARGGTLHPLGEVAVHHRESREHDRRDQGEEDVGGDQLDQRQDDQHDHAGCERDGQNTSTAAFTSASMWARSSPVGVSR